LPNTVRMIACTNPLKQELAPSTFSLLVYHNLLTLAPLSTLQPWQPHTLLKSKSLLHLYCSCRFINVPVPCILCFRQVHEHLLGCRCHTWAAPEDAHTHICIHCAVHAHATGPQLQLRELLLQLHLRDMHALSMTY